jgi:hypothetical protein
LVALNLKGHAMKKQWILVANGSLALIFSVTSAGDPLVALETIDFPEGRLKAAELERDRQGHESSDNSSAAAHFEPRTSAHQKVRHQFARELAERLEEGLVDSEYETLWPLPGRRQGGLEQAGVPPASMGA